MDIDESVYRRRKLIEAIAKQVRRRREARGLSRQDLAQKVELTYDAIYKIETQQRLPSKAVRTLLAAALQCKTGDLERYR